MTLNVDGVRRLAAALLIDAICRVRRKDDAEARHWLLSEGLFWMSGVGLVLDDRWWEQWILDGCPGEGMPTRFQAPKAFRRRKSRGGKAKKSSDCAFCGREAHGNRYCCGECRQAAAEERRAEKRSRREQGRS